MEHKEDLGWLYNSAPFPLNEKQKKFLDHFINESPLHSTLLGLAGCGKSTLLSLLKKYYGDEIIFLGATGVSSQNMPDGIGLGTGHGYLSLPTKPSDAYNHKKVSQKCSQLLGTSDLVKIIVIDEAYLYNSDNLDMIWRRIERFNKKTRNRKKRNIRLLLVGDVGQSLTIANRDLKVELRNRWKSHLMFDSTVWERFNFTYYVLDKVERQEDKIFKSCLDVLRYYESHRFNKCLSWLNKRVNRNYDHTKTVLAATNKTVDSINKKVLGLNPNPKIYYKPSIKGQFDMNDTLMRPNGVTLCKDLKVMAIVNDKDGQWSNGSVGVVTSADTQGCWVKFDHLTSEVYVPIYTWENKETYVAQVVQEDGSVKDTLKEKLLGSMECIQLLPTSAISISKSQGLTIKDEYILELEDDSLYTWEKLEDFGTNFAYLGLSRGTDINNITLARPITKNHIKVSHESIKFWFKCVEKSVI